jgi:hypothetical protein
MIALTEQLGFRVIDTFQNEEIEVAAAHEGDCAPHAGFGSDKAVRRAVIKRSVRSPI